MDFTATPAIKLMSLPTVFMQCSIPLKTQDLQLTQSYCVFDYIYIYLKTTSGRTILDQRHGL